MNINKKSRWLIAVYLLAVLLGLSASLPATRIKGEKLRRVAPREKKPPYRWPLNIFNGLSSSFQEFRGSHFHGGFDLRTHQKNGYPVFAVADGYVLRVRSVKRGSGNGIYIKHKDGNVSIYYHLDRFEKRTQAVLDRERRRQGKKYIGNYYPKKRIYYKRGQVIAYSGETGSGFPHLHFEVRDADNIAVNPFPLVQFPAKARDKRLPIFEGILLKNREDASIDGEIGSKYIRFRKKSAGFYVLSRPFVVTGPFDLTLKAHDRSDVGRRIAPYSISAVIDNRLYYYLSFDRFEWGENNQLGFVYDMEKSTSSRLYYNLYYQEGFSLETQKKPFHEIFNQLENGKHQLKITLRDHFDNVSTGMITFYKVQHPQIHITGLQYGKKGEPHLALNIEKLSAEPGGTIHLNVLDSRKRKISSGTLRHHSIEETKPLRLTNISPDAAYLDFTFSAHRVPYAKKRYIVDQGHLAGIDDIPVQYFVNRDDVYVTVTDPHLSPANLRLRVLQGGDSREVEALCLREKFYYRFKPLNHHNRLLLHFTLIKDGEPVLQVEKKLNVIYLKNGLTQDFAYHEFSASFAVRSVYEPRLLLVEERNHASTFPILSRQVSVSPVHFPFLDTVHFKFKKKLQKPEQVGIFRYSPKSRRWSARYSPYNAKTNTYSIRLRSAGTFALMRDIFPPRIWWVRPHTRYKKNLGLIIVKLGDKGKGINDDTLKIWLNRVRVNKNDACEYDPDRAWVKITGSSLTPLKKGQNTLKVTVQDYAKNQKTRTFTFSLK